MSLFIATSGHGVQPQSLFHKTAHILDEEKRRRRVWIQSSGGRGSSTPATSILIASRYGVNNRSILTRRGIDHDEMSENRPHIQTFDG